MKYAGMPMGMWMLFHRSFTHQLTVVLGQSAESAKATEKAAKQEYRRIIARVPDFEPGDRFQMNLVNCAMLCAYVLHMPNRADADGLLREVHDDARDALVLPQEREEQVL